MVRKERRRGHFYIQKGLGARRNYVGLNTLSKQLVKTSMKIKKKEKRELLISFDEILRLNKKW